MDGHGKITQLNVRSFFAKVIIQRAHSRDPNDQGVLANMVYSRNLEHLCKHPEVDGVAIQVGGSRGNRSATYRILMSMQDELNKTGDFGFFIKNFIEQKNERTGGESHPSKLK